MDREHGEKNVSVENIKLYEDAEQEYSTKTYRYIYSWFGIVCFYGIVLMIVPLSEAFHRQMDASNWTTLFKKGYTEM